MLYRHRLELLCSTDLRKASRARVESYLCAKVLQSIPVDHQLIDGVVTRWHPVLGVDPASDSDGNVILHWELVADAASIGPELAGAAKPARGA